MAPRSRAIHPLVQRLGPSLCPASASDIPLSARGSALHCSIGDIFKTQRGIPHPTGLWKRVFWETSHPKPGANGQPGTTRAARGDQQLMASRWKWHRPPSAFLLAAAALWEVGKTQDALCHSTSIWISGFWILRGSPDALSDHHARPAQIPPCTSCLRKKAARPPGSPSTGRRTAVCFGTCTAGFSLHRARNTKSKKIPGTRKGLATIQDSIRAADMSKSGTITEPGIGHAKQSTRAQEWPKMTSTWTPDSSFGFPKPRHLENINSSNPNALNPDASAGQHNLH